MAINLDWAKRMVADSLRGMSVKAALLTGYTENPAHSRWGDVVGFEVSGANYDEGGKAVALDVVVDTPSLSVQITSTPIAFGILGVAQANAIVFWDDATARLLATDVFPDGPVAIDGTKFTYAPPDGVVLTLSTTDDLIIEP